MCCLYSLLCAFAKYQKLVALFQCSTNLKKFQKAKLDIRWVKQLASETVVSPYPSTIVILRSPKLFLNIIKNAFSAQFSRYIMPSWYNSDRFREVDEIQIPNTCGQALMVLLPWFSAFVVFRKLCKILKTQRGSWYGKS